jgi:hypothetical protein
LIKQHYCKEYLIKTHLIKVCLIKTLDRNSGYIAVK